MNDTLFPPQVQDQKILKIWTLPANTIPNSICNYNDIITVYLSEDTCHWGATDNGGEPEKVGEIISKRIKWASLSEEHPTERWEAVRQHTINELLSTIISFSPYNDLDRFTDLEE